MTVVASGPRALVIGINVPAVEPFADALRAEVGEVRLLTPATPPTAADLHRAFEAGIPDLIVVSIAAADRAAGPLLGWDAATWQEAAGGPQFALIQTLQSLRLALDAAPCAVVVMGAVLGQTGAANHVALAVATEGQRGATKSIARQWGATMRLNWLSLWPPLLFPDITQDELPEQVELGEYLPSLTRRPTMADAARAAAMLGSPMAGGVTGQTIIVDGGEWMLP